MEIKKFAATTAMAGALGLSAFALGSGLAQADPGPNVPGPNPPGPVISNWAPGDPPGHNPFGPPGQVKQQTTIAGVPNPLENVPPGHWDDRVRLGIPDVWLPPIDLRPDLPDLDTPLKVEWNAEANAFGVFLTDGRFVAYPVTR
ncbi:hypothetical protein [Mycobacterium sp. 852002-51961_SCH5331710]|uniref:hypothetical protein n=1 Tax=Mycobacterium sp. 852002-51961_SCH5331710 TaxID=1834105 RepID=UPI0008020E05|nr:hypothetical protein [Mycobacterium sp. 852002-51961_SCH5331710]OBB44614.1 hypothetical protein A5752_03495 [Mycobacterium sp. 852002-51961_SCH5331710]